MFETVRPALSLQGECVLSARSHGPCQTLSPRLAACLACLSGVPLFFAHASGGSSRAPVTAWTNHCIGVLLSVSVGILRGGGRRRFTVDFLRSLLIRVYRGASPEHRSSLNAFWMGWERGLRAWGVAGVPFYRYSQCRKVCDPCVNDRLVGGACWVCSRWLRFVPHV